MEYFIFLFISWNLFITAAKVYNKRLYLPLKPNTRFQYTVFIRAPQYLCLVNQLARGNEKSAAILDLAYSVSCLVLDDLGVEQATPAAIRQFYELVEERRGTNGLYTVITSNLSIDDLEERWRPEGVAPGSFHEGMRVTDRLRENWGELEIEGVSLRATHWQE